MKKTTHFLFTILIFIVLIARIVGWFVNFSDDIDKILTTAMFTLIGIAYVVMGFTWDNKLSQFIMVTCGVLLIVFNFFETTMTLNIIGIVCILTPLIIARLDQKKRREVV
jgi:hypothetical protein